MKIFTYPPKLSLTILALGAESAGTFSVYKNGILYSSDDFGDLLEDNNFRSYTHELCGFLKKNKFKPNIILTDLHPIYKTVLLGRMFARKYKAKHIQIQHHHAHIFSAIGDRILQNKKHKMPDVFFGIAIDGTGYGPDDKIWGGEVFKISKNMPVAKRPSFSSPVRIGRLENQTLLGNDIAIQEPARMLISILCKFLSKKGVYRYIKKHYPAQKFEILYHQLRQNFNCTETSSTGRVLDAVSVSLGFCDNQRKYKHEPIDLLEKNSTKPYILKPDIIFEKKENLYILKTTTLLRYLEKNLRENKNLSIEKKGRLAATAQLYIAKGLYEIIRRHHKDINRSSSVSRRHLTRGQEIFMAGGIAGNKIISAYLESRNTCKNHTIPVGDAGLSFGQIFYYLLTNSRN